MKAPREEEEGGIIAQGANDVNGILSKQAANVRSASISRRYAYQGNDTEQLVVEENHFRIWRISKFHSVGVRVRKAKYNWERRPPN